jgi:RHS repeat-associated protein
LTQEVYAGYDASGTAMSYTDTYAFDLDGNRLTKTHSVGGTLEETSAYVYDANDRLLSETDEDWADSTQDRFTAYQYGPSDSGTEQTDKTIYAGLDDTGAGLEDDSYSFNLQGDMAGAVTDTTGSGGGVTSVTYSYDAQGNRVSQTINDGVASTTTLYLIDGNNLTGYRQTLEEKQVVNGTAQVTRSYAIGIQVIGQQSPGQAGGSPLFFITDGHGSTRLVLDSTGQQPATGASRFSYDAYGNALGFDPSAAVTTLLYSGQSFDSSTGLQYLRARWYSPSAGRFVSMDSYPGSTYSPLTLNQWTYCQGSPVIFYDPSGCDGVGDLLALAAVRGMIGGMVGGIIGGVDSNLGGGDFREGFMRGFGYGFLFGMGSTAFPVFIVRLVGVLMSEMGMLSSMDSFANGNTNQGLWRLATGGLGAFGSVYGAGNTSTAAEPVGNPGFMDEWYSSEAAPYSDSSNYSPDHLPGFGDQLDPRLPTRSSGDPTNGVIDLDGQKILLESQVEGPGERWYDPEIPAVDQAATHVEGHAAGIMVDNGLSELTVTINNSRGPCPICTSQIPDMLPSGATLNVRWMDDCGIIHITKIIGR